jgi:hypothetical protein
MRSISSPRTVVAVVVVGVATMLGVVSGGAFGASERAVTTAARPPQTVRAVRITQRRGTLPPGSRVRSAGVAGQRVFTDARHGVALASVGGADYPVATSDGGMTWKTNGPALHLHAAQAPLAVGFIGAKNRGTVFAWGGGQVIDTTRDGGKNWYSALFTNGSPIAVVHDLGGHLLAFIGSFSGAKIWQYVSRDGGRTWRFRTTVSR